MKVRLDIWRALRDTPPAYRKTLHIIWDILDSTSTFHSFMQCVLMLFVKKTEGIKCGPPYIP